MRQPARRAHPLPGVQERTPSISEAARPSFGHEAHVDVGQRASLAPGDGAEEHDRDQTLARDPNIDGGHERRPKRLLERRGHPETPVFAHARIVAWAARDLLTKRFRASCKVRRSALERRASRRHDDQAFAAAERAKAHEAGKRRGLRSGTGYIEEAVCTGRPHVSLCVT